MQKYMLIIGNTLTDKHKTLMNRLEIINHKAITEILLIHRSKNRQIQL